MEWELTVKSHFIHPTNDENSIASILFVGAIQICEIYKNYGDFRIHDELGDYWIGGLIDNNPMYYVGLEDDMSANTLEEAEELAYNFLERFLTLIDNNI